MKEIKYESEILARLITAEDIQHKSAFFSRSEESIQVGVWSNCEKGKRFAPHIHNAIQRSVEHTCEVLYIVKGALKATIYNSQGLAMESLTAATGDILILLNGGHEFLVEESDTLMIEIKNGPYLGAEIDRRKL